MQPDTAIHLFTVTSTTCFGPPGHHHFG